MPEPSRDPLAAGRNETPLQRCDRNLVELLQEVRVVQTGVQVLFAFLLTAPLSARFPELSRAVRIEYFITMLAAGAAAVLLIAPTARHRLLFRCGDKEHLVTVANRYTLAGLACVAIAMLGAVSFVSMLIVPGPLAVATPAVAGLWLLWSWCLAPLHRRGIVRRAIRAGTPTAARKRSDVPSLHPRPVSGAASSRKARNAGLP